MRGAQHNLWEGKMIGRRLAAGGVSAGGADDQQIEERVHDSLLATIVPRFGRTYHPDVCYYSML